MLMMMLMMMTVLTTLVYLNQNRCIAVASKYGIVSC